MVLTASLPPPAETAMSWDPGGSELAFPALSTVLISLGVRGQLFLIFSVSNFKTTKKLIPLFLLTGICK